MKIKSLNIKNFKSIVDITINEPNPFTVFVGPNGSGKSNIFEALQLLFLADNQNIIDLFGGLENILNWKSNHEFLNLKLSFLNNDSKLCLIDAETAKGSSFGAMKNYLSSYLVSDSNGNRIVENDFPFSSRVFLNYSKAAKFPITSSRFLASDGKNLEKVLKRLLEDDVKKEEITDWLSLFIPEFDRIEVQKSQFSSNEDLLIYQKYYNRPFDKELISDGTYNIIALLTAVYQSDEPQFLCIEEPENGLHPFVIRKLVDFFRQACEDKGHYIWLNTHSQTLVESLTADEVIVVDKVEGETRITQLKGTNLHGLDMSEYWLSGATGGGTPW